tara:strand:+ start:1361 stop:1834 length:474 start_codon:yes stop_codon:yes gene_type:complete
LAAFFEEGFGFRKLQGLEQAGVVAEARVQIQWQVGTVDGEVVLHEFADEVALLARPWLLRAPKQAVMDDQQVGLGLDGLAHGGKGGIHGGGNAADLAVVFDLQSVHGAVVIGDFINLQGAIAVPHDILEQCLRHADRKPMTQSFGNDRLANFAGGFL